MNAYVYDFKNNWEDITNLLINLKLKCSIDKPCQEATFVIPFATYSTAYQSNYYETGRKFEIYEGSVCLFRGHIENVTLDANKDTLTVVCYDNIRNITKSSVTYNFDGLSAFECICKIFDDLRITYVKDGILGGENGEGSKVVINHLVKNKSAYDTCMMIATEVYNQTGTYYYMFMDVSGNVNVMPCDRYWSGQTIQPCTDPSDGILDGTMISLTYKEDASNIVTTVALFDSKGNKVDCHTGESVGNVTGDTEEGGGSTTSGNGKVIGIDMGHSLSGAGTGAGRRDRGELIEVEENRKIGKKLISKLKANGFEVVDCTVDSASSESEQLAGIVAKANRQKLDLFLSIHLNAGGGNGTSVHYSSSNANETTRKIGQSLCTAVAYSCNFNVRGLEQNGFYVLRHNNNQALLLEVCFVDSKIDAQKLDCDRVASAICDCIRENV